MSEFVYVLSNPSMKNIYKVGFTKNSVDVRAIQLYTTGIPTKFEIEFCIEVLDGLVTEKYIHGILNKYHHGKEFFKLQLPLLIELVKEELLNGNIDFISYQGNANKYFLTDDEIKKIKHERQLKLDKEEQQRIALENKKELNRQLQARESEEILTLKNNLKINVPLANSIIKVNSKYFNSSVIGRLMNMDHFKDATNFSSKLSEEDFKIMVIIYYSLHRLSEMRILKKTVNDIFKNSKSEENGCVLSLHRFSFINSSSNERVYVARYDGLSLFFKGILSTINITDLKKIDSMMYIDKNDEG